VDLKKLSALHREAANAFFEYKNALKMNELGINFIIFTA